MKKYIPILTKLKHIKIVSQYDNNLSSLYTSIKCLIFDI